MSRQENSSVTTSRSSANWPHRLRKSNREERTALFASLYNELFERVPDHPRLTRRATDDDSRPSSEARMRLLSPVLAKEHHFFEFAPGDCKLAYEVAGHVTKVVAADISDQREPTTPPRELRARRL